LLTDLVMTQLSGALGLHQMLAVHPLASALQGSTGFWATQKAGQKGTGGEQTSGSEPTLGYH
jgi:hypothetical protein